MGISLENKNKNTNNNNAGGGVIKQAPPPSYAPQAEIDDPEAQTQGSDAVWEKRKQNSLADSVRGQILSSFSKFYTMRTIC